MGSPSLFGLRSPLRAEDGRSAMKKVLGAGLTLGLILKGGLTKLCQGADSDSFEAKLTITIHVYNYADVSPKTLVKAEKAATSVFRKAGVKTLWTDMRVNAAKKREDSAD